MPIFKPRKVRIQRTKKPWLHRETKQLFALGDLGIRVARMFAVYSGNIGRAAYEDARTDRMIEDIELKVQRKAYVRAQTERTHLLNELTRRQLALIPAGSLGTPAPALMGGGPSQEKAKPELIAHACPRCETMVTFPPTSKDLVEMKCHSCGQEWEIYPQGAEVMA